MATDRSRLCQSKLQSKYRNARVVHAYYIIAILTRRIRGDLAGNLVTRFQMRFPFFTNPVKRGCANMNRKQEAFSFQSSVFAF